MHDTHPQPRTTTLTVADGLSIFVRSWRPERAPRAIVVICHGVKSHSGYYSWAGARLAASGFAVHALDLRGRGQSSGERFYVEHVSEYVEDVHATVRMAKAGDPGVPLYLLGHSAGGVVSCTYALDHSAELAGLVCESFAFRVYAPDLVLSLVKGLSHVTPHVQLLDLKNKDFSRDPAAVATMDHDPLIAGEVQPIATVAALTRADDRLDDSFDKLRLPLLILHGSADKVTKPEGSRQFHAEAGSADKTLRMYDGHAHDLLNDLGREVVLHDICAWIEERIPA